MQMLSKIQSGSALEKILTAQLNLWPEHGTFLETSFRDRSEAEMEESHHLAELLLKIVGSDLPKFCEHYRWTCDKIYEEELNFRRSGAYRFSNFQEVEAFCYSQPDFMGKYVDGLLFSQVLWRNHLQCFSFFRKSFLGGNESPFRNLELGPGHGLFTYFAAADEKCGSCSAWDVSPTALESSRIYLKKLNASREVNFELRDIATDCATPERFNSVILSEVLEHIENPKKLLESLHPILAPKARIFVNVPINSPAPDHIYLLKTPEEALSLVESAGYTILDSAFIPMTGYGLERARKLKATISCVIIASLQRTD